MRLDITGIFYVIKRLGWISCYMKQQVNNHTCNINRIISISSDVFTKHHHGHEIPHSILHNLVARNFLQVLIGMGINKITILRFKTLQIYAFGFCNLS